MLRPLFAAALLAAGAAPARAEPPTPSAALARMPVKEVTVFKDGHAYVVHQGVMPTDAAGNVALDQLPTPVLGTFWPYSLDKAARLESVTAGRSRVAVERTALSLRELLEANVGAEVVVAEGGRQHYAATVVRLLTRSAEELEATAPPTGADPVPVKGNVLLLKTADGTRAVPIEQITDVKFVGKYATTLTEVESHNLLTLKLDWGGKPAARSAEVGMAYVQKGVRWIPGYRVELQSDGQAVVKLQATLLNELADLKGATVNLVVGVPSFFFKDTADPIALSQAVASLSPYFQTDASTQYALSNSMMTQVARGGEVRGGHGGGPAAAPDLGPAVDAGMQGEDLFVYTVKNVTLARGQRMVLPIAQHTLAYKDVYSLDLPAAPPAELRHAAGDAQAAQVAKLMAAPKVMHKVRLTNGATQPLTTAPALVLKDGRVVAQGMMTYTPKLGSVDVALTAAVDVRVKKADKEGKRTPEATRVDGHAFWRIDLTGTVALTNAGAKPVEVEVTRHVLGQLDTVGDGATAERVNVLEDDAGTARPAWWGYYSWPGWWGHLNGVGRVTWTVKLAPGQTAEQAYAWHYFWR